ncbi:interferon kappa [Hemicordylus capensis]|uniref:interferon kappa n=1 Tax=Hemicordylus capensis TaxID=884348 RepID=UPI002303A712|nr:interferon kappa [Hemicordylus capensis]
MATTSHDFRFHLCFMLALFGKFAHSRQLSLSKCPKLHIQWNQLIQTNLHHLCRMSGQFPPQCGFETTDLQFPLLVLNTNDHNSPTIVHEILQQIFCFLSKDHPWNSTCIEKLQTGLHEQITELETCLGTAEMQKGLMNYENTASYSSILQVKKYFQRMNSFLTDEQHSQCAWEEIRLEMKRCFLLITQLLKKL